jgi:hypothetical protein
MSINYLQPDIAAQTPWHLVPLVKATNDTLIDYGCLVNNYENFPIEIVTWPKPLGRLVDEDTGNQAGTKEGIFEFWWEGDYCFGKINAVEDEYLLGWSNNPKEAERGLLPENVPDRILLWHANYHPDGGQLFYPLDKIPFIVPLALPSDDIVPQKFIAFYFDGTEGLYIHPNIWHEGVFPLAPKVRFYDIQGAVHARVSVVFAEEFGVLLNVPLHHL